MRDSKAQLSVEYIVLTAFLIVVAGLLFGFALFTFTEKTSLAKADAAVTAMTNNANWVASLGDGSKVYFEIDVPNGVSLFQALNKTVNITIATSFGDTQSYNYSGPNLTSVTFTTTPGKRKVSALFEDGNVIFSEIS